MPQQTYDNQQASPNMAGNQPRLRKRAYWDASIFSSKAQRAAFVEEKSGLPVRANPPLYPTTQLTLSKKPIKRRPHAYASSSSWLIDCTEFTRIRPWTFEPFFKVEGWNSLSGHVEKNPTPVWHTPQLLHHMGDNDDKRRLRAAAKSAENNEMTQRICSSITWKMKVESMINRELLGKQRNWDHEPARLLPIGQDASKQ